MVGRRLREQGFFARTIQLKLRYSDFTTITRAHTVASPTCVDTEIFTTIRKLFYDNWEKGRAIRLLGVQTSHFGDTPQQMGLLEEDKHEKWVRALSASDRLRDKYGESAIFLAKGMAGKFRERVHENSPERPEKKK
jgi:DNA polymerase-4